MWAGGTRHSLLAVSVTFVFKVSYTARLSPNTNNRQRQQRWQSTYNFSSAVHQECECVCVTHSAHRHLVGCQGSCLIRTNDRGAAQGLNRWQTTDNGVLLGHAASAQGQAGSDHGRETLGDCGHGQRHSDLEVVDRPTDPGASVDGVVEVSDVDDPHGNADEGDDLGQLLAKLVKLLLQGRLLLLSGSHLVTNLTNLCVNAGGHNHTHGLPRRDVSTLK